MTAVKALLFVLLLVAGPARAAESRYITPEMDKDIMEGVDDIYRMRFDAAEDAARRAIAIDPEEPHAYIGLAGAAWTKYVYGTDQGDESLIKEFEKRTEKAIAVGEAWTKKHPDDAGGLMTLGAAYGVWSRLLIVQHSWVRGYLKGRRALTLTKEAVKKDPQYWDAYLGLGMYEYYSDLYPHFIGALAKLVLRGNRKQGIDDLEMVAEKGHFSQSNARILLVEIYTEDPFGARSPEKAVLRMNQLRAKYPDSAMMHSAQLVAWFTAKRYEDVVKSAREYVDKSRKGEYGPLEQSKGLVILGTALWAVKRTDEAESVFTENEALRQNGKPGRWQVWGHIKHGQMLDALGKRDEALKHYKAAAAEPDRWDFRSIAKGYISKSYAAKVPESIPPP